MRSPPQSGSPDKFSRAPWFILIGVAVTLVCGTRAPAQAAQNPPTRDDWSGVQGAPAPDADAGNYTTAAIGVRAGGTTAERRQDITYAGSPYEAFMRGLECDFSPHLPPDPHPFWGPAMFVFPLQLTYWPDVYANNPWYDHAAPPFASVPPSAPRSWERRRGAGTNGRRRRLGRRPSR